MGTGSGRRTFWLMMAAIFLGNFSAILSSSTMVVPLPRLMVLFDTDLSVIQWAVTAFTLATGIAAPTVGYLCGRFGSRRTYIVTLAGFLGTSFLCASAWNVETLILFRAVQGLFAGVIIPVTMTLIYTYVERREQAFAISMWSMSGVLAPACGPTVAGFLVEYVNWQGIFLMNVPISLLAIIISLKFLPKGQEQLEVKKGFDLLGLVLGTLGTTVLLVAFSFSQAWGIVSVRTLGLAALGALFIAAFVRRELGLAQPLLNFKTFYYKSFAIGSYSNFLITLLLNCSIYLLPLYLQSIRGFNAVETGLIVLVGPISVAIVSPLVGKLYRRERAKAIALTGLTGMMIGFAMLTRLDTTTPIAYIMIAIVILESGMGTAKIPAMNYGMEALPKELSAHGSSITSWLKQGASAFAVGIITSVVLMRTNSRLLAIGTTGEQAPTELYNLAYAGGMTDVFWVALVGVLTFALTLVFCMKPATDDQEKMAQNAS